METTGDPNEKLIPDIDEAALQAAKEELHAEDHAIEIINPDPREEIPED